MITLYGIDNCDTVRKAKRWLERQGVDVQLHDFRRDGLPRKLLQQWLAEVDAGLLLNRRSTSWRALPEATRQQLLDAIEAGAAQRDKHFLDTLIAHPTLVKRPVAMLPDGTLAVGFDEQRYQSLLEQFA